MSSNSRKRKNNKFQNKLNNLILKTSLVTFSFVVIIVLFFGLFIGTSLYGNYSKADSDADKSTRIDFDRTNLSLMLVNLDDFNDDYTLVNNIFLLNINLHDNAVGTFEIPLYNELEYSHELGSGDLEKLYAITAAEKLDFIDVLKSTIFKNYAINVDKFIVVDKNALETMNDIFGYEKYADLEGVIRLKNLTKINEVLTIISEDSISDIVYVDALKLLNFFRNLDSKNFNVTNVDGSGDYFNTNWQKYISISNQLQNEQLKVFIANASIDPKIPGLASWGKSVVENIGGIVMNVDNSFIELSENTIITSSLDHATYKQLAEQFGINNVILKDDIDITDGYNPEVYRSEISVYLVNY